MSLISKYILKFRNLFKNLRNKPFLHSTRALVSKALPGLQFGHHLPPETSTIARILALNLDRGTKVCILINSLLDGCRNIYLYVQYVPRNGESYSISSVIQDDEKNLCLLRLLRKLQDNSILRNIFVCKRIFLISKGENFTV